MDFLLFIVMLMLGLIGSFFSGLLGIGGAIVSFPLLLFVPSAFGVANFTGQEVSSISMFQVFFASLAGVLTYLKNSKNQAAVIRKGLVVYMGAGILFGSLAGGLVSGYLDGRIINIIYGVLAIIAVILMLIPSKGKEGEATGQPIVFNRAFAVIISFLVGIVSGIVGAGGAFILIPVMLTVMKIPTRITIASSLAIVFISAVGGVAGKLTTAAIPWEATLITVIGSLLGAPFGSWLSARMNVKYLRYGLIVLIALTAIKVWMSIL
ncbi:sulfite exporter TauE/SafE family protein [Paenibacillus woosongensis]|uniref:Probable membrane transporter protein n=1 Tax=Paenibacillus woosongensis TaxID=307580 RepID=A0AA95KWM7_9BACL|nr:sulfite exporter TauE/SafE family protein [Paenibacillus woosongensis]WHX49825.1 sulfite exporter TauE/SafE family protein [Paenibacillus woosongensis]